MFRSFTPRYNGKGILWFWSTRWCLTVVCSAVPYCVNCTVSNYRKQCIVVRYNRSLFLGYLGHLIRILANEKKFLEENIWEVRKELHIINVATARLQTTHLLIWIMCPSTIPLSFMDLSACCVQTLRPSTFKSIIFFRSSGEPSAEHKCKLVPRMQLLHRHQRASTVIRLLTYFASLCEEGLCTVPRVICVNGSVRDVSRLLDIANKVEWFHMSFCWISHRFYALFAIRFVLSVRLSARKISVPTGRIFMKISIRVFFENLEKKF